jgi:hypothetical protein
MNDIYKIYEKIIPPNTTEYRYDFSNTGILNRLTTEEKKAIEQLLIKNLVQEYDQLIVLTLGELKSMSALPTLRQCLNNRPDNLEKIIIASTMFEITNNDDELANICIEAFKPIEDDINSAYGAYHLVDGFFFLAKFHNPHIRSIIAKYVNHPNVLISATAKRALERIDK